MNSTVTAAVTPYLLHKSVVLKSLSSLHHSDNGCLDVKLSVFLNIVLRLFNLLRRERSYDRKIIHWTTGKNFSLPAVCPSAEEQLF